VAVIAKTAPRLWLILVTLMGIVLSPTVSNAAVNYRVTTLLRGLDHPYAMVFLPDGDILVTEKRGTLQRLHNDVLSPVPVAGVEEILASASLFADGKYCGLLDIALHPRFQENQFIYLSLTAGSRAANAVRVIRARYVNDRLQEAVEVFTAFPTKDTANHPGGRLAFIKDGTLLITIGDGFDYREKAQDLHSMLGKIVRVKEDGQIPQDNPFMDEKGGRSAIWSYGHRHPQGILYDAQADTVYEHEHGPRGGDELNVIAAGKNYGWPLETYGVDYSGAYVSPFNEYRGTEQPLFQWTPSLAPSGITQCCSIQSATR